MIGGWFVAMAWGLSAFLEACSVGVLVAFGKYFFDLAYLLSVI